MLTAKHCVDEGAGQWAKVGVHEKDNKDDYEAVPILTAVWPPGGAKLKVLSFNLLARCYSKLVRTTYYHCLLRQCVVGLLTIYPIIMSLLYDYPPPIHPLWARC